MVAKRKLVPPPIFDELLLTEALGEAGIKPLHIARIWSHLLADATALPQDTPGLPYAAIELLKSKFTSLTSKVLTERTSQDGTTTKLLISLQDGKQVEAVIMRHDASSGKYAGGQRSGSPRATLCVSSQVGCQMACTFCATGTMGLSGNLTAGEIMEQLVHAMRITPIRNVVFMGMGEPLNNYDAVVQAVRSMTGTVFGLSHNHITVSTVGIVPKIMSLPEDVPGVNLALSLHAPNQELRAAIVPAARAFPLPRLMEALDLYLLSSGRSVFVEYVMLSGVNDAPELSRELGALLQGRRVVVNLIPYNPTGAALYEASRPETVLQFQKILREEYGLHATVRQEMGQDIGGACGQLVVKKKLEGELDGQTELSHLAKPAYRMPGGINSRVQDIEDLCTVAS